MGYTLFMIVKDFSGKFLWFGSCIGLMYIFPMSFEMFNEQQKILMKIQMNEMMAGMGGGDAGPEPAIVRPF